MSGGHDYEPVRSRRRYLAFVILMAVLMLAAACGSTSRPSGLPPPASSTSSVSTTAAPSSTTPRPQPSSTTAAPATTVPPTSTPTGATPPATLPPGKSLQLGDAGTTVVALQTRLARLGYWLGPIDGHFGTTTQQAVYALQKAAGVAPDGVVGPVTQAALNTGVVPLPRSTSGHLVEIDLSRDLLMIVTNGKLDAALNTSTGGGYPYVDRGITAIAATPEGTFKVYRQVDGMDISPLGELWRPKYFNGGIAIHGYTSVPPYPVSHGCVRLSYGAIDWIWATGQAPLGTKVWVYR